MPKVLCFDQNGPETVSVLADIRRRMNTPITGVVSTTKASKHRRARQRWSGRYRSFEALEEVSPAAALVLAAEYERILKLTGTPASVIDAERWKPEVLDTFWDIGFFDIVGLPQNLEKPDLKADFAVLPMRSGDTADGPAVSALLTDLKALYPGGSSSAEEKMLHLYGAMVEGIVNVVRHAYPVGAKHQFRPVNRWWMTGAVDRKDRWTTAVIYDQGITIPGSLPNWQHYSGVRQRLMVALGLVPPPDDPRSDGQAIAAAVEESVSSTGDPHRGHGLAQMRDFVNQCTYGYLRIMSRHGEVVFRQNGQREIKTHGVSIGGTLIEWRALL
ncbi:MULTISPECIES: hypothetical protein [unclassified Bradyrhizobium]|uniref:hypothetical protein n=1 Tax=unclassified Bradyrhizobium TaxID=2631580 RepID=UPI0029162E31|nr:MULTISPECIES: hypothetical protein [unclassified Bradyrhizobium]